MHHHEQPNFRPVCIGEEIADTLKIAASLISGQPAAAIAKAVAIALILCLFTLGNAPEAGLPFQGHLHWIVHLATFALIAIAGCVGWPPASALRTFAAVTLLGILHEATEIVTHQHSFETADAAINGAGALLGVGSYKLYRVLAR